MPSLGITAIYFLPLIVTTSSHASLNVSFDPFNHYSSDNENGTEENIPIELHRQKRQVAASSLSPVQYTADIEISSTDSLLLESIKDYLVNLRFPVPVIHANGTINISSINVTTVCKSTSNNETHCSCESGYKWPAALCSVSSICPNTSLSPEKTCDCITQLPSQGSYCLPQPDISPNSAKINMSLRLNISFQDALRNSSSDLYKKYKSDLESAFTQSYKSLPGFVSATVTGFRAGSVIVDYEVNAASATVTEIENANANVPHLINASYQLDPGSFTYFIEITGQANLSVSPANIFQGDTVTMNCETPVGGGDVIWYHSGKQINTSTQHSMISITIDGVTKSKLEISNVTLEDAGPYMCTFMNKSTYYRLMYSATNNVTVSPINIVQSEDVRIVCNSSEVLLSCCVDRTIQSFLINWRSNGAINIPGISSSTTNCTVYTLQAKPFQCPRDLSGTKTTYTCELSTGNGAVRSKAIEVTYVAIDISPNSAKINMSLRLNVSFQDALRNSSSDLYKKYKSDLESAFTQSYNSLPGFVSATVTGFRAGSVIVVYEVNAASATVTEIENANANVARLINASYQLDPGSFTYFIEITGQANLSVSPANIFQGDTVTMNCETPVGGGDVIWYHSGQEIKTSTQHSMISVTIDEVTKSKLEISNVTLEDAGPYTCTSMNKSSYYTLMYSATNNVTVSPINIVQSENIKVVCNSANILLSCCVDRPIQSFWVNWTSKGAINIPGTSSSTINCTEYTLQAKPCHCPSNLSGTKTTYTCELSTGNGAVRSKAIEVTYVAVANAIIIPSTKTQVSEGHRFSLTCISNVSNYDNVTWQIQSGNSLKSIDDKRYIKSTNVTSNLTVDAATLEWNGTYTCTFFQNCSKSSASVVIEIVPLPLKQNILLDPIVTYVGCNVTQPLSCCIYGLEDYTVTFIVEQKEFKTEKNIRGNKVCYVYNYTGKCRAETVTANCNITNRINDSVTSSPMTLNNTSETIMCSDSIGVGTDEARIIKPCPVSENGTKPIRGNVTYECKNKAWILLRNNCLSDQINTLLSDAELLLSDPRPAEKVPNFLEKLINNTVKEQNEINSSPGNLEAVITILDLISTIPMEAEEHIMNNFLSTVNILVNDSTRDAWKQLNSQTTMQTNTSSLLLDSVERFSRFLRPVNNTIPSINNTNLQLQGTVITENSTSDYKKSFAFSNSANLSGNVQINRVNIQPNTIIISVAFATLKDILSQPAEANESVNGLVMTTTVNTSLTKDFQIGLTFAKSNPSLKNPRCVFWNFSLSNGSGGWDGTGCSSVDDGDNVTCNCSHLTSFSILMSPSVEHLPNALDYITYIGVSISILSLVVCILIESLVWKSVTKNRTSYMRHVCILNIAVSLLIADIWFIVAAAINKPADENACIAATFFIHLFYLCVFFWMLVMGLMIFYRLVFILHVTSKTIQKTVAFSLGYGCPLIIAVITIAVTQPQNAYKRKDTCWLNWEESKALLAFVIPALIIVAVNSIIAIVVIVKILRPHIGDKPSKQERSSLIQVIKSVSILTPLLGLTWGFGLATIIENSSIVFHILFTLLNAFQGLFILLFGTLWDKKVQEALLNNYSSAKWSSQQTKSTSLDASSPMFSMGFPFSRALNNLLGKAGKYKISSRETTCSSIEQSSNSYSLLH